MKLTWHGKHSWGFPPISDKSQGVLFKAGSTLDLPKEWLAHWYKLPQVKTALLKGVYGGLEVVGRHDKTLQELYGEGTKYAEEASAMHIAELKDQQRFLENRVKTLPPVEMSDFRKSGSFFR